MTLSGSAGKLALDEFARQRALMVVEQIAGGNRKLFGARPQQALESLAKYVPLSAAIENYRRSPANQQVRAWLDHRAINQVMLATSLLPDEFLAL